MFLRSCILHFIENLLYRMWIFETNSECHRVLLERLNTFRMWIMLKAEAGQRNKESRDVCRGYGYKKDLQTLQQFPANSLNTVHILGSNIQDLRIDFDIKTFCSISQVILFFELFNTVTCFNSFPLNIFCYYVNVININKLILSKKKHFFRHSFIIQTPHMSQPSKSLTLYYIHYIWSSP